MKKIQSFIKSIPNIIHIIYLFFIFFILLLVFLFEKIYNLFEKIPLIGKLFLSVNEKVNGLKKITIDKLEGTRSSEVKRIYLINLAYKNMMLKKTRSFITILGMSVGVGAIVLLLSLGYGVEKLIIGKVASLNELKMVDVSAGDNTTLKLNDSVLKKISKIKNIKETLPVISLVGRISYNRAETDVLVYAVPDNYQNVMTTKIKSGQFFSEAKTAPKSQEQDVLGQVAGAETGLQSGVKGDLISDSNLNFNILPQTTVSVWKDCQVTDSAILGYSQRILGGYSGKEYWGGDYYPFSENGRVAYDEKNDQYLGKWIKANLPLYEKKADDTLVPMLDKSGHQVWADGCLEEKDIQINNSYNFSQVLGVATDSAALDTATVVSSDSSGLEFVTLQASGSAQRKATATTIDFKPKNATEAVVSSSFLNLLGIPENKAIGTKFNVQFVIVQSLMPEINGKSLTSSVQYTIKGVVDDPDTTYIYVPFSDVYQIGLKNFSQFKVVLSDQKDLPAARKLIETMGFRTASTIDTVVQIENLFNNLRIVLAILGLVALGVASLGMFNTLTVSLLERTRETGGMKAIGMVSDEVQDLFLAEAMIMGLSGGFGGLLLGWAAGQLISFVISVIAISRGQGYLQLTYLPPYFVIFIIVSAFIVGLLTGLYPAYRAKKTSALNALRYE